MTDTRTIPTGILLLILLAGGAVPAMAAGTQTPLTFTGNLHAAPAADGDWVAWEEFDYTVSVIHVYHIATGTEYVLPHASDFSHAPFIGGDRIVWLEDNATGFNDLYWSDLPPGPVTYVATPDSFKAYPVIGGDRIVWQDNAAGFDKVLMYDISNGLIYDLAPDAPPDTSQQFPRLYGDVVVWQDYRNYADADIWMNNTDPASWEQKQVVLDPANQSFNQEMPVLFGDTLVYQDDRAGTRDIYTYDISLGAERGNITPDDDGLDQLNPEISGDRIIWTDPAGMPPGELGIALFNLTTGTAYPPPVTGARYPEFPVRIANNRIVWSETREGSQQVYLYTDGDLKDCPVAGFAADPLSGSPGLLVDFTDRSVVPADNPVTRYFWDFGDTGTSSLQNPGHTFDLPGTYPVTLTVSNLLCRNVTPAEDRYTITIGPPTARFTVTPRTGLVPFTVVVTDTSTGEPDTWNWSFGDGTYADIRTATHTYTTAGTYAIRLNVSNSYGMSSASGTVVAMKGMNDTAYTAMDGLTFRQAGGRQQVTLDPAILPDWTLFPNTSVLEFTPPPDRGWGNISLFALDGTGFTRDPVRHTIHGNVTGVVLRSREMVLDSLSPATGQESTFHYHLYPARYPVAAVLNTQVWEGMTGHDLLHFTDIASHAGYGHLSGTAYTVKITTKNIPENVTARLYMSANASWIRYLADWKTRTAVPRYSDDEVTGEMLPAVFLSHDPGKNLDRFEVISPHGLSTFGLSQTTGSGNPFQLITLTVTSHVEDLPPVGESTDTGTASGAMRAAPPAVVVTTATATPVPTPPPPDPGRSATVYSNAGGVVTQATRLRSTDNRALLVIAEGVVARDAGGSPLAKITLAGLSADRLPPFPVGSAFTFAGMAYGTGPDRATFSPPAILTLTLPQASWGQDYSVKAFDQRDGTWQDLPTSFDAATGAVTAEVPTLMPVLLFSRPRAPPEPSPAATPLPVPSAPPVAARPPATAVDTVMSMLGWAAGQVMDNLVIVAGVILILVIAVYLGRSGTFMGYRR